MRANPPYALRDVAIAHADPTIRWKKRRDRTRHIFRAFPYSLPEVLVSLIEVRFKSNGSRTSCPFRLSPY
jgi:hypothetical protein